MRTLLPTRRADHRGMGQCLPLLQSAVAALPGLCTSLSTSSSVHRSLLWWSCVYCLPHVPLRALSLQNRVSSERLHVVGEAYATSLMAPLAMLVSRHRARLQAVAPPPAYLPVGATEADYEALDASPVVAAVKSGLRYFLCTLAR
jgi:hypothetical protein